MEEDAQGHQMWPGKQGFDLIQELEHAQQVLECMVAAKHPLLLLLLGGAKKGSTVGIQVDSVILSLMAWVWLLLVCVYGGKRTRTCVAALCILCRPLSTIVARPLHLPMG